MTTAATPTPGTAPPAPPVADPVVRAALDAADPAAGVSAHYAQLKREEFYRWHAAVSAWEIDRYLTAF